MVKCLHEEDVSKTSTLLKDNMAQEFGIDTLKLKNARLKIIGIDDNMPSADLENDINERKFSNFSSQCPVIHNFF